ncbi:MAG: hypothetical protein IID31_05640 [Planctomycetes bacterium]|nr:hypothetical protein [Planctomycetota bacterium]
MNRTEYRCAHTWPRDRRGRRLLTRVAAGVIGGGMVLAAGSPASAQFRSAAAAPPGPTLGWQAREFQDSVNGPDNAVDIQYWFDDITNPGEPVNYVFITGWQTTSDGATVFATHKYEADYTGQGENEPIFSAFYPDPSGATGTNKAVAMAFDPDTGDVYVTGESSGPNGQDYVTIRYNKDLGEVWTSVSRYNGPANGDDIPVDIVHYGSTGYVVAVTGRSLGVGTGDDIATVLYNTLDGTLASGWWPSGVNGPAGERRYDGPGVGPDRPVGVGVIEIVVKGGDGGYVGVFVSGTESTVGEGDNIVTLAYTQFGFLSAVRSFDGPESGDDVATAMVSRTKRDQGGVYVPEFSFISTCGYTPGAVQGDTDYVVVSYWHFINGCHLPVSSCLEDPYVFGDSEFRIWGGPAPAALSDDRPLAIDIRADAWLWITGRVREAEGTAYDIGTIQYDMYGTGSWTQANPAGPDPTAEWIWGVLDDTNEWGTAVDAHGIVAYVGGRVSRGGVNSYAMFKFDVRMPFTPVWTALHRALQASDTIEAIVALDNAVPDPVFVAGGSGLSATGKDQLTLRYDQP